VIKLNRAQFFLICFLAAVAVHSRDIYVCWSGTNNYPFTNWPDAATNLEWAVNAGTNGETVWISNGTYVLTNQVTVRSNLMISGTGGLVVVDGNNAVRCFSNAPGTVVTFQNLTITRGYAADASGNGGGIYMYNGILRDSVFSNNVCTNKGGGVFNCNGTGTIQRCVFIGNSANANGGGFFLNGSSNTLIETCSFKTNTAGGASDITVGGGGGLCAYYLRAQTTITGCDFISNISSSGAGGAYFNMFNGVTNCMTRCTFTSNVCYSIIGNGNYRGGGGIMFGSWGAGAGMIISNCCVSNNIANSYGGGVNAYYANRCSFFNCVIARNTGAGGGGFYFGYASPVTVQNCTIDGNISTIYGGGIEIANADPSSVTIRNCLIKNNPAASSIGGGVWFNNINSNSLISCTIVSNYAGTEGGGVCNSLDSTHTGIIENCIIYFNTNGAGYSSSNLFSTANSHACISNCFFGGGGLSGETTNFASGNITNAEPLFVNRAGGDYHLQPNSPCVNAGVNRDWMNGAVDLDGLSRIDHYSGIADMGCYEYLPAGAMYRVGF
jgi:hypothetical protein